MSQITCLKTYGDHPLPKMMSCSNEGKLAGQIFKKNTCCPRCQAAPRKARWRGQPTLYHPSGHFRWYTSQFKVVYFVWHDIFCGPCTAHVRPISSSQQYSTYLSVCCETRERSPFCSKLGPFWSFF